LGAGREGAAARRGMWTRLTHFNTPTQGRRRQALFVAGARIERVVEG